MSQPRWLLAIDTATSTIVVAGGTPEGELLAEEAFEGRYRHSQELLPAIIRMTDRAGLRLPDLAGIVAGTGPGAFTGLRVGLATAKTLAHELRKPIVGVSTAEALLAAVDGSTGVWLPSGARDRVLVRPGDEPRVVRRPESATDAATEPGTEGSVGTAGANPAEPAEDLGRRDLAVDLDGRAAGAALALGREAVAGLGASLLRLGARRLAAGDADDPERLVPVYASPPRGMPLDAPAGDRDGGVAWSRDPR